MNVLRKLALAGVLACAASVSSATTVAPTSTTINGVKIFSWEGAFDFDMPILIDATSSPIDVEEIVTSLTTSGIVQPAVVPVDVVPLPASATLLLLGFGALALRKRLA